MSGSADDCGLCVRENGLFDWGQVCCRARFVIGLPGIEYRRGWMARWKARENAEFYAQIAAEVKARWDKKTGVAHGE